MIDKSKIRASYQGMVNEMTAAIAVALNKKDFVLLDQLKTPSEMVYLEMANSMVELEVISEEQALTLYNKWRSIEDRIDHEEMKFTTESYEARDASDSPEDPGTGPSMSLDDMRDMPEELW